MLARREHSRAELTRKLSADGTREDIQTMLDQLEQTGLLSDARFAEAYVSSRAARAGNAKLRHSLRARGVAEAVIAAALPADSDSELERACEVWRRKFGAAPVDRVDYARQARFLQQRGFAADTIRRVLKEMAE
ncbi:MAG: recombination regulator RecX [Rhodocyclaceae bacterium]|nr:recombination regulator RecX [Rhodocyclaceae bacterium]